MQTRHRFLMTMSAGLAGLGLLVSLTLVRPLQAQKAGAPAKSKSNISDHGGMDMRRVMGPMKMNMTGTATTKGQLYNVRCNMTPDGKPQSAGMTGGNRGMRGMRMDRPMEMTGTMTMMGQKYRFDMVMTPTNKKSSR